MGAVKAICVCCMKRYKRYCSQSWAGEVPASLERTRSMEITTAPE